MVKIKGIIFDLDDTLFDCTGTLTEAARRRAAEVMVKGGLPLSKEDAYKLQLEIYAEKGERINAYKHIAKRYGFGKGFVDKAKAAYNSDVVAGIKLFDDVEDTLKELKKRKIKLAIITTGVVSRQNLKIDKLGIRKYFDKIVINESSEGLLKEQCFLSVIREFNLKPKQILSVGDRVFSEIRISNYFGMNTVRFYHGRFRDIAPESDLEVPDFTIHKIKEILNVIEILEKGNGLKVVGIGGGTGLAILAEGLKKYTKNISLIVTVTDSGRSSGVIRKEFGILPPGDIRNCLVALSRSERLMNELFQYRYENQCLEGMSFGNLFIATLAKVTGSFEEAVKKASEILAIQGKVIPSTLEDTHLCAELEDGTIKEEEFNVREVGKSPIKKVYLQKKAKINPEALDEIKKADLIIIGPGSLYTSVITNLLVKGMPEAIKASKAKKVFVCNIVTQAGQTDNYDAVRHIETIKKYLGKGIVDYVFVNKNFKLDKSLLKKYEHEGAKLVSLKGIENIKDVQIIRTNLIEKIKEKKVLWEKQYSLRHDPDKLAECLLKLVK